LLDVILIWRKRMVNDVSRLTSVRMFLLSCRSWTKKVVDALKCASVLSNNLSFVFLLFERVLHLNVCESSQHLGVHIALPLIQGLLHQAVVERLPHLCLGIRLFSFVLIIWRSIRSQGKHVLSSTVLEIQALVYLRLVLRIMVLVRSIQWRLDHRGKL
jgi:hypothetical protein